MDSAECLLEISLVAWSPDAEGMLAFHRYVWEKTDRVKEGPCPHEFSPGIPKIGDSGQ